MITTLYHFCLLLTIIILSFLIGWFSYRQYLIKIKKAKAKNLYRDAYLLYENESYGNSLRLIGEAIGNSPHREMFNLLGHIYDKLQLFNEEADSFHDARCFYTGKYSINSEFYDQDMTFYFYRESFAYMKFEDWEFAYLRSNEALGLIRSKKIPSIVDEKNFEQELVAIRMVSSLYHFKSKDAFEKTKADALWLQMNSPDNLLRDLSKNLSEMPTIVDDTYYQLFLNRYFGRISKN